MCIDTIKQLLFNDKNKIIYILEELGCHKINPINQDEIRCALPDGTTSTSVQVFNNNEFIPVYVYSRGNYDDYEIKDIISFTMFIHECGFNSAVKWLCGKLGIEYDESKVANIRNRSETLETIRKFKKSNKQIEIEREILDEEYLNQFPLTTVDEWLKEGIDKKTQDKYKIRIDEKRCRYLIPIYDDNGKLVSLKGRTYLPNYDELDINKYIYYNKIYRNDILFGLNFNIESIRKNNEIILFEGEKSVMKADSMGFDNCVSIGKNGINKLLIPKILKLKCNVILALDKDVSRKDVITEANRLAMFTNVFYIYDNDGLLDKKDAPVDQGLGVFMELYENKIRV